MKARDRMEGAGHAFLAAYHAGSTPKGAFRIALARYSESDPVAHGPPDWAHELRRRVAAKHGHTDEQLLSRSRWSGFTAARQEAVWMMRQLTTPLSFPLIATVMNRDHHTTMITAYRACELRMERDPALAAEMAPFRKQPVEAAFPERRRQQVRRLVAA